MITETETKITEDDIGGCDNTLSVIVRHDNDYESGFLIRIGCHDDYMTSADLRAIVRVFNKALAIRKAAKK